jgi:hypothetical protein
MLWRLAVIMSLALQPAVLAAGGPGRSADCVTPKAVHCCMAAGEGATTCCASPAVCGCVSEAPAQPPARPQRGASADQLLLLLHFPSVYQTPDAPWREAVFPSAIDELPPRSAQTARALLCIWLT